MKPDKPAKRERIEHILQCIQNIQSFTEDHNQNKFEDDVKVYYVSLYQFAVIGEAVSKIDDEILKKYDYPWYRVKSFRNFIMHEYHAVDAKVVWDTIVLVLPEFRDVIKQILEKEF